MRNLLLRLLLGRHIAQLLRGYRPPEGEHNSLITGNPTAWQWGKGDHGSELDGLEDDDHPQYLNTGRHDTTDRHGLGTVVPHDALADLSEKAHGSLTGVSANQHHAEAHTLASHSTKPHSALTGVGLNDHAASDPVAGTAGLRTLGTGAQQAAVGNHSHTLSEGLEVEYGRTEGDENAEDVQPFAKQGSGTTLVADNMTLPALTTPNALVVWGGCNVRINASSGGKFWGGTGKIYLAAVEKSSTAIKWNDTDPPEVSLTMVHAIVFNESGSKLAELKITGPAGEAYAVFTCSMGFSEVRI